MLVNTTELSALKEYNIFQKLTKWTKELKLYDNMNYILGDYLNMLGKYFTFHPATPKKKISLF